MSTETSVTLTGGSVIYLDLTSDPAMSIGWVHTIDGQPITVDDARLLADSDALLTEINIATREAVESIREQILSGESNVSWSALQGLANEAGIEIADAR